VKSRSSPPGKPATRDLFVDRPISSAQEDLLGRSGFAQTLATAILAWRGDDSLTIAVSGDWGSGKTSLKNMLLERLREYGSESPEIVEFNPWKWSTQDKISSAFFREISIALNKVDKSAEGKKRVRRWQRYGRLLTFGSETVTEFSNAIPALLALATIFGLLAAFVPDGTAAEIGKTLAVALAALVAFLKFVGGLATKFAAFLNGNLNDLDEISLEERKTELKEDLLKLPKPVLVVIDDMDRITKEETRLLLQHVKANADFPKMVYLLLYHEEMVANHFAEPSLSGKEFLEKIVQLPFDIPAISQSRVQQVLFAGLDKTLNTLDHIQLVRRLRIFGQRDKLKADRSKRI